MRTSCESNPQSEQVELLRTEPNDAALAHVLSRIDEWQPTISSILIHELTSIEVTHIQTQIRVSRLSMKLLVHRLIYLFGEEDSAAQILATAVMLDLGLATAMTGVQPDLLTFVIAAFDVPSQER